MSLWIVFSQAITLLFAKFVFVFALIGVFLAFWIRLGYIHLECHPMFSTQANNCSELFVVVSQQSLLLMSSLLPHRDYLSNNLSTVLLGVAIFFLFSLCIEFFWAIKDRRYVPDPSC